ncbi:hypothetical protein D3C71_1670680 [compost metagenome]
MIIQADLLRHRLAFAQGVHSVEQLLRLLGRIAVRIRSEIFRFIFKHPSCHFKARMAFVRDFDVGKSLVILQQHIITRHMLLDQVALQNERFHVAAGHNVLEVADVRNEPLGFAVMAARKIGADPVLQHLRFANVNNGPLFVLHQVASG